MSDKAELKPCPFCGGDSVKMTSTDGFTGIECPERKCIDCLMAGPSGWCAQWQKWTLLDAPACGKFVKDPRPMEKRNA